MKKIKKFEIDMSKKQPDFAEVIKWLESKKYCLCEIERLKATYYDTGTVVVAIRKVNPPGPPVAKIKLVCYNKYSYGSYNEWDVRGPLELIKKEVILKAALQNH
ncbi:hypothetical protein KKC83_04460 [Patescibacteria group bacterium]|nr:hypothetical protein [Candidatus Falkowbacteria bacterium]MBU3906378.1 hypothetical protein [Patescibacteria group bacterium]MBU4015452.1 hypothetical protein [Patescibacteria group bacterium]MBU4026768.1 hypothetical protein [Patescibacteria group bacterium]MBU4072562.1 hypothetical protein [Patescibacteria group bacterium]